MEITAEIMQTYNLLKFAIAQSNGSTLLKILPYNTTWSAFHKHEWSNKKGRETEKKTANEQKPRTVGVV